MANYHQGPNAFGFSASRNAVPSTQDLASHNMDSFDLDKEQFINTQFLDFDLRQDTDLRPLTFDFNAPPTVVPAIATKSAESMENVAGNHPFLNFASFLEANGLPTLPISPPSQTSYHMYPASNLSSPHLGLDSPWTVENPPADAMSDANYVPACENASRLAVERNKRLRNTAASARFRVKKKQREQTLHKSTKEMADKINALEGCITQLEIENKWLKSLIVERNEKKDDVAALWIKYHQETAERKAFKRKNGVESSCLG